jgi:hypothetical protein
MTKRVSWTNLRKNTGCVDGPQSLESDHDRLAQGSPDRDELTRVHHRMRGDQAKVGADRRTDLPQSFGSRLVEIRVGSFVEQLFRRDANLIEQFGILLLCAELRRIV